MKKRLNSMVMAGIFIFLGGIIINIPIRAEDRTGQNEILPPPIGGCGAEGCRGVIAQGGGNRAGRIMRPSVGMKRQFNRNNLDIEAKVMDIIKSYNPSLYDKISSTKETDPLKYRHIINVSFNLFELARDVESKELEKSIVEAISLEYDVRELGLKYEKASAQEKTKIKDEIKSKLDVIFDIRTKIMEARLKRLEDNVKNLKSDIENRKTNKKEIVENRLNQIIKGRELSW